MARVLGWLLTALWRYVAGFALLFGAWLIVTTASGALRRVSAELESRDGVVAALEQARADAQASAAEAADAWGVEQRAQALVDDASDATTALAREAAELQTQATQAGARATAMAQDARDRAEETASVWDARVRESCNTRFYQFARRAVCDATRVQRDAAMDTLHSWEARQLAARAEVRATADALRARADEQVERLRALDAERAAALDTVARAAQEAAGADARAAQARANEDRLQRELDRLDALEQTFGAWVVRELRRVGAHLALALLVAFATPYLYRTIVYFVVMRGVHRARPLRLAAPEATGTLEATRAERTLRVSLGPGETLWARSRDVRPVVPGAASTQLLFDWRSPLVSLAAGLYLLTRIHAREDGAAEVRATLAPSGDGSADVYLLELKLDQHPGVVLHPRHLVAVRGDVRIVRRWAITSLHAWATGQLRYVLAEGTGSIYLEGTGDVVPEPLEGESKQELHQAIVAFDARLAYSTRATETFVPYLLGLRPLVEIGLQGDGIFVWQKSPDAQGVAIVERTFGAFWSGLGKVLGF